MPSRRKCANCGQVLPAGFARTDCPACGALLRPSAQSARSARTALGRIADWTLETEISRSPRAVVFRARHATTGQPVAVKVLSPPAQADSDWTEAALERLERATRLRSEHTVRVQACGMHDGSPYAVLDWTDEGSLAGDLPLPPTLAARLVAQVAEAVHEAHAAGLVHGGISLGHLFVDERGNARLVGFAAAPRVTRAGDPSGSDFGFLTPEQARRPGTPAGIRSDVYALGSVLFTMLTGAAPFRAATTAERLRMLRESDAPSPLRIHPALPRGFETVCARCLAREPARRYDTALALAADLDLLVRNEPLARRSGGGGTFWQWLRRRPGPAFLLTAVIGGLAATSVRLHRTLGVARQQTRALLIEQGVHEQVAGDHTGARERFAEAAQIGPGPDVQRALIESLNLPRLDILTRVPVDAPRIVRFAADGTLLAVAGAPSPGLSGTSGAAFVSVFKLPDGSLLGSHRWLAPSGPPAFHPERPWLAWPQPDDATALWAPASAQPPARLPAQGMPVFSPDGNRIALGAQETAVFDVETLRRLGVGSAGRPPVWLDDESLLLRSGQRFVEWRPATGTERPLSDPGPNVAAVAAAGEVVACWSESPGAADYQLEFRRPTDGALLWAPAGLVSDSPRIPVVLRRHGTLAFVSDPLDRSLLRILDVARRRYLGVFTAPGLDLEARAGLGEAATGETPGATLRRREAGFGLSNLASALSPDGRFFAAALDRVPPVIEVHDLADGRLVTVAGDAVQPAWSADGRWLAWFSRDPGRVPTANPGRPGEPATVTVARLAIPAPGVRLDHPAAQLLFSSDGREVMAGGERVLLPPRDGDPALQSAGNPIAGTLLQPTGNGDYWTAPSSVVTGARSVTIATASGVGDPLELPARPGITALAFSPDGDRLLAARVEILGTADEAAGRTNALEIWNLRRQQREAVWPAAAPGYPGAPPVFTPDGSKLACALFHPEGAEILDAATGERERRVFTAETGRTPEPGLLGALRAGAPVVEAPAHRLRALRFSSDGTRLLAGTAAGWVCSCTVASGRVRFAVPAHQGEVTALAVSHDDQWLATCSVDGTLRLARGSDGRELARWEVVGRRWIALEFSPDGRLLMAGSSEGSLQVWHVDRLRRELRGLGLGW